jgi:DNA-directed RNA polymerase subunit N|tara:strand:+ start:453 stop:686 length:234 start_codon:yes stop_codon:yes gene_type:complete
MIQPIRCFTCGKIIADQIDYYNIEKEKLIKENSSIKKDKLFKDFEKNQTGIILDKLGATRYCCRRMFITDVDMMNII